MEIMDCAISSPPPVDELPLCDEDIREAFRDRQYMLGMPLMAQLIKELKQLREALRDSAAR